MSHRPDWLFPQHTSTVEGYSKAFQEGKTISVQGLCGRILRGKNPNDFVSLTDDPNRKIVMLMGPDGLSLLPGKSGHEMLTAIGYTPDYINQKILEGTQFKLAVFPESKFARPATWSNMVSLISHAYPQTTKALHSHYNQLSKIPFEQIQTQSGFSFAEVEKNGPSDPRFMTIDRFMQSQMNLVDIRAFLYFSIYLKELFSGDGYTYSSDGYRGMQEFATLNQPINSLGKNALLDINI
jgi:hypothetical protein